MPYPDGAVFGTGDDDGKFGVVAGKRDIVRVAFESGNQRLGGVVPDLDGAVIGRGKEVRFVGMRIVIDVVYTLGLMRLEGEVRSRGTEAPDLDCSIQTCGSKGIRILGVDGEAHDIVAVALEYLHALPALLPIPQLDGHVIRGSQHEGLRRVNGNGADVVGMRLERGDLFGRVVVVDSHLEVIGTANNPVLPCDEPAGTNGDIGEFESLDDLLSLVGPDVDVACRAWASATACDKG